MPRIGLTELVVVLVIIVLLMGVGRIEKIAGELGAGIKAFKKGLSEERSDEDKKDSQ